MAKGLDLVALRADRTIAFNRQRATLDDLAAAMEALRPGVVAIDGPPGWAAGGQSRTIERRLLALGVACFPTPAAEHELPLHAWMRTGFAVFAAAAEQGYPLFTGAGAVEGCALEVFPHATAVFLRGSLPAKGTPKAVWRRAVLEAAGVETAQLSTLDQVDAALAALTGLLAIEGIACWIADGAAALVVPGTRLPVARFGRDPGRSSDPKIDGDVGADRPGRR